MNVRHGVGPGGKCRPQWSDRQGYVVDRARVNGTTRYSPEAPAEGLYQVGLFTSALSHLYHGYFEIPPVSSQ